ncbi:MAG: 50S ribosomal protein L29 [Akkermansia sp.]|nr:50S ribosomal protein L29 [Akkermansia sp.]
MPVKKAKDFRGMSVKELEAHVRELRKEYFDLRMQKATGQLENNQRTRIVRKELACALTVLGEGANKEEA